MWISGQPWAEDEAAILKDAVPQHKKPDGSIKWSAVAAFLPGRTDSEVARQYYRITE